MLSFYQIKNWFLTVLFLFANFGNFAKLYTAKTLKLFLSKGIFYVRLHDFL